MRFIKYVLAIVIMQFVMVSCDNSNDSLSEETTSDVGNSAVDLENIVTIDEIITVNKAGHEEAEDYTYTTSNITEITLNANSITIDGTGATATGSVVKITNAGTYRITGNLTDGQVIVSSTDAEKVQLIFNGINVNCSYNAPIYVKKSAKTIILLQDNTVNYISDGVAYEATEEDANAAVFSKSNLSIGGNGTLNVTANFNDGITSKDGLIINSGTINVTAIDDAIRGKDYLIIDDGILKLNAGGDGLKSDEEDSDDAGFITINKVDATIVANNDAIQAETNLLIYSGKFTLTTGGGSNATLGTDVSAKAIKSAQNIAIAGGTFTIDAADDGVHSNNSVLINSGTFEIATGDDAIHSDEVLQINGGTINISKSYEGIESSNISINDGTIHLVSSDDGINAAGSTSNYLYINGGYIVVNATGDGLDANGYISMTNGTVIVNGPTANNNAPLDYDGTFKMTGGFLVAVGSSGMAQNISSNSTQYGVLAKLSSQSANQLVNVQTSDGTTIFSFKPSKAYQSIVFSSPKLVKDKSYNIYVGGTTSGTNTDGLYLDGTYSAGTKSKSFTISNIVTNVN